MNIFLIILVCLIIILLYLLKNSKNYKSQRVYKFKKKHQSKESNIEKIFLRDDEKTFSNPNININIGLYENEEKIKRKSNIHRARLSKFKKSMLNGEIIYMDEKNKIYKYIDGQKHLL